MRLLPVFALLSAVQAMEMFIAQRKLSSYAIPRLMPRADECDNDVDPPYTCEKVCGPGNISCGEKGDMCFNPDAGEMCCQDGTYCGEGSRCTDNGCCDKDDSLDQCDAKKDTEFKATSSQKPITVTKTISKDRPTTIVAEETTAGMLTTTGSLPTETSDEDDGEGSGTGPSRSKSTTNVGAIAGGVVGGVAVVAASIVAGVWLFLRHKRRMAAAKPQEDADDNVDNNKSTKRPLMEYFKPSVPPEDPPALAELPVTAGGAHHIDGKPVYEMDGGAGINNNADTSTNTTAPLAAPAVNNNGNLPLR